MSEKPFIHPSVPRKLKSAFRKARYKYHRLAQAQGINVRYIHDLIKKGIEPTNPNIRQKLFLPKKPRAPYGSKKKAYVEPPEYIKWWNRIGKFRRHAYIRFFHSRDVTTQ